MAYLVRIERDCRVDRHRPCDCCGRGPARKELRDVYGRRRGLYCRACARLVLRDQQEQERRDAAARRTTP